MNADSGKFSVIKCWAKSETLGLKASVKKNLKYEDKPVKYNIKYNKRMMVLV